jgi:hypothetical protein
MKFQFPWLFRALAGSVVCLGLASGAEIKVTITNLAPANGTYLTPMWVGFHNGSFDTYDPGVPASLALERIAEDGDTAQLMTDFTGSGAGAAQATLGGGPFGPGNSVSMIFTLDAMAANSRYFSYASMVVPSNDAFIANGNPLAFSIFSPTGMFLGADFIVLGSMVNDAGSEVNDEVPMNTAFFGQMTPNTGVAEGGVVGIHPGFLPPGSGGILDDPMFANADFKAAGYQIARIQVEAVPEPSAIVLFLSGLAAVALFRLKLRRFTRPA